MPLSLRLVFRVAVGIGLVGVLLAGVIYLWLRSTLPDYTKTLSSDALVADVVVSRDEHGVAHIEAATFRDAAFGVGYAQAQDRLWQMETMRYAVEGRTAEIFGKDFVATDLTYRVRSALPTVAQKTAARIDEETKAIFQAFADGVNLAIEQGEGTASPEWDVLGVTPRPWTASDVNNFMTVNSETATDGDRELYVAELQNYHDQKTADFLLAELPPEFPTLYIDFPNNEENSGESNSRALDKGEAQTSGDNPGANNEPVTAPAVAPAGAPDAEPSTGTNFFVFGPSKTATKKPILAVDPHLPTHAPSLFYPFTITLPDDFIAGAAWVGSPSIAFGQNSKIAWGMTHLYADTVDYIIEKIDPDNPQNYLTPEGSKPFVFEHVKIRVKGGEELKFTIRKTENGVVVSDSFPGEAAFENGGLAEAFAVVEDTFGPGHVVVRKHVAVLEGQTTVQATLKMSRAHSWDEFRDALRDYEWTNNVVFADVDGNIGVQMSARLPAREIVNGWDGQRLARGWLGEGEWNGYIPFDDLPYIFNPDEGWAADSNSRTVNETIPFRVTDSFSAPWRIVRAYDLIRDQSNFDVERTAGVQLDTTSAQAGYLLDRLLKYDVRGERTGEALTLLKQWDRNFERDRPEPLLYSAIELALQQLLVNPHAGPAAGTRADALLLARVLDEFPAWCDDPNTSDAETCEDAIAQAIDMAITSIEKVQGKDMSKWRWGAEHKAHFPAFYSWANAPIIGDITNVIASTPGGDNTLNQGSSRRPDATPDDLLSSLEFKQLHGATFRLVADLSDPKNSLWAYAPGVSGNAFSPHYDDMARSWADGDYIPMLPDLQGGTFRVTKIVAEGAE